MLTGMMDDATTIMIEDILESRPMSPSTYWHKTCWLDEDNHMLPEAAHDQKESGMTVADNTVNCLGNLMLDVTHEIKDIYQNGRPVTELPAEAVCND